MSSNHASNKLAMATASAVVAVSALAYYGYSFALGYSAYKKKKKERSMTSKNVNKIVDASTSDADTDTDIPKPLKVRFEACTEVIKNQTSTLTTAQQLQVYGLYKQATLGNCTIDAPSAMNVVQYRKHKAWKSLSAPPKEMDQMTAMQEYIDFTMLLEFTKEMTNATDDQADIVYPDTDEEENDKEDEDQEHVMDMGGMGLKPSTPMKEEEQDQESYYYKEPTTDEERLERDLHIAARDNQPERLTELLLLESSSLTTTTAASPETTTPSVSSNVNVNSLDDTGQTALHLAADRGHLECVQILLDHGADVHATDQDGISILQTAVISGHVETCRWLLQQGADPDQQDMDGDTPRECAKDDPQLRNLIIDIAFERLNQ